MIQPRPPDACLGLGFGPLNGWGIRHVGNLLPAPHKKLEWTKLFFATNLLLPLPNPPLLQNHHHHVFLTHPNLYGHQNPCTPHHHQVAAEEKQQLTSTCTSPFFSNNPAWVSLLLDKNWQMVKLSFPSPFNLFPFYDLDMDI